MKQPSEIHFGGKEEGAGSFDMIEHLLANPLNVERFKPFAREEIYERQ
ncbi:MAG: hypothetical protein AB1631_02170 [Acidobacteriota bacterium]